MMIFDNEKFSTLTTIFQMEKYLCWVLLLCGGIYATVVLNGSPFFSENTSDECGCATHDNYVNYVWSFFFCIGWEIILELVER